MFSCQKYKGGLFQNRPSDERARRTDMDAGEVIQISLNKFKQFRQSTVEVSLRRRHLVYKTLEKARSVFWEEAFSGKEMTKLN